MISAFFIRRPIVAMVIAILTVLIGAVSLLGLPIAQFPQIIPPQINLSTTFTGADAVTIEQSVATPIEQQVNGVDNMLYIQSTNANDGTMNQRVTFDVGTNIDIDNVLVQNRFSQAQTFLPQDVKNYGVTIKKSLAFPLIVVSLYSPDGRYDASFLTNYATINVNDALLRIRGVGDIRNLGASDYAMRVWLKPDKLASLSLTVTDIENAIRAQNVVNPAGQVGAEPTLPGQQFTYTVRAQGRLVTPEEFGEVIVRENPDGSLVRVRDVATLEMGSLNYNQVGSFNGKPAGVIAAFQLPGSNALDVAASVRAAMEDLKKRFPPGMDYQVSLDTTAPVKAGIEEILITLLEAIGLVVLVVFVFLQSWRATLIPLLTVPVSLVGVFAVFPFLGFSINTLSLFALVLAIGLVVDDAIVVVEAVEHHIEEGMSPRDATYQAMSEVTAPVVGIALILAAVFIPVAFMAGITGRLYQQFALTIAVSVLISAFNALTLSPALAAMLLRPRQPPRGPFGRAGAAFNRLFDRVTRGYVHTNARLIRKLVIPLGLLGGVAALAGVLGGKLPSGFVPEEDNGYAIIGVQLPDAASLQRTRAVFKKVEEILGRTEGVRTYNTVAGYSFFTGSAASYVGTGFMGFRPWKERDRPDLTARAILGKLNAEFARIPEARVFALAPPAIPGISAAGGFSLFLQDRAGGSVESLAQNVKRFVDAARKRPELQNVIPNFSPSVPQLFAEVDKEKALKQGVPIADVYATLQAFLGGAYVNDFTRYSRQWKVFVQAAPEARRNPDDLQAFYVRNLKGEMVPLASLVHVRTSAGPEYTVRFNLYRSAEVIGAAAPGYSSGQAEAIMEQLAKDNLPKGMVLDWTELTFQKIIAGNAGLWVYPLSLLLVFLVLAAQYESFRLPLAVILVVPMALFSAMVGLWLTSGENNVFTQIGLIVLIGLAAKNAILIVEFALKRREEGASITEAALDAARLRLRPILMTSIAFIAGVFPLVVSTGAGAEMRRAMGVAVFAGMIGVTFFGLFLTPVFYVVLEKLGVRKPSAAVLPVAAPQSA